MRQASRWPFAALAGAVLAAVHLVAHDPVVRESAWKLLVIGSLVSVVVGVRRHRPPSPQPWYALAAALAALTVTNLAQFPVWETPGWLRPLLAAMELVSFPLMALGGYMMVRRQSPGGDRDSAIDAAIVLAALATVLWDTAVVAGGGRNANDLLGHALIVIPPLVLAGITTAALRLLFVSRRTPATYFMVCAASGALLGHIFRTYAQTAGTYSRGSWEDMLIAAAYIGTGLAALHPSMPHLTRPQPLADGRLSLARLTILGAALLTPPMAMLLKGRATAVPLVSSMIVTVLVLVRLWRLVSERESARQRLRWQALHDPLTGLPNRAELRRRLQEALTLGGSATGLTAVMFLDLDGFKQINDDYGHRAGDQALVAVAARLTEACREEDLIGRLAGDEFVLVCDGVTPEDVEAIAERVLEAFDEPFTLPLGEVRLGASIGVAMCHGSDASAEQLLAEADAAMYAAKDAAGSAVVRYDEALGSRLHRRRSLERDLEEALHKGQIELAFRPVIDLTDQDSPVRAVEAAVSWRHPQLGVVEADELELIADGAGRTVPLGDWIAEHACARLARWRTEAAPLAELRLLLPFSARQLRSRHLPERFAEICHRHGLAPADVIVEAAGTALRDPSGAAVANLRHLHEIGFGLGVAGSGVGSIEELQRLPLELVLLDERLAAAAESEGPARAIVSALVGLVRACGSQVAAGPADTPARRALLRDLGCDLGVGGPDDGPIPLADDRSPAPAAAAATPDR